MEMKTCTKCSGLGYIVVYKTEHIWNDRLNKTDKKIISQHIKCYICRGKGRLRDI